MDTTGFGSFSSTLTELLRTRALRQPERRAYTFLLEDGEVHFSYAELDRRARALGALLQSRGAAGERVLLLYPPGPEYLTAFFGCLYAGALAVPAYPPRANGNLGRLQAVVADAEAAFALTTGAILTSVERRLADSGGLKRLAWIVTDGVDEQLAELWTPPSIGRESLAFLQYTSGSTSTPKGVMLSHGNLLHNLALIEASFGTKPEGQGVIWLPPYHDMGLIGGILQPLYTGYPMVLMPPVAFIQKPVLWLEAITKYGATVSGGPNFAYELCVQKVTPEQRERLDLSTWETAFTGAEPIRRETLEKFASFFAPCGFRNEAFYACYGLAEGTLFVTGGLAKQPPVVLSVDGEALTRNQALPVAEEDESARALVSSGRTDRSLQQVLVVDAEAKHVCPDGQVGEIWVSGPSVAQGYWRREGQTEETFQARLDGEETPFLRTGDLGFVREGELYVTGRMKDLIIIRGRNHYPQDIEATVQAAHEALRADAGAAFAVEADGGERLVIVQEVERTHRKGSFEDVIAAVRQAVAGQHELQVHAVVLIRTASIPKTSSGKIQRHVCKERFQDGALEVVHADVFASRAEVASAFTLDVQGLNRESLLEEPAEKRRALLEAHLLKTAAEIVKVPASQMGMKQSLSALGLDSMMAVELKGRMEEEFGVEVPMAELLEGPTVEELAEVVLQQVESGKTAWSAAFARAGMEGQAAWRAEFAGASLEGEQAEWRAALAGEGSEDLAAGQRAPFVRVSQSGETEFPLSYGQRAMWFLQRLASDSSVYHIAKALRITGDVDVERLRNAFANVTARHPMLRTRFVLQGTEPVQQVLPHVETDFAYEDARFWTEEAVEQRLAEEAGKPFDLERAPLFRVRIFKRAAGDHLLLACMHHIISDFWSLGVMMKELSALYAGEEELGAPSASYADHAERQALRLAGEESERQWQYWREQLKGSVPVLNLPTDRPRPPVQTYNGASRSLPLDAKLSRAVKDVAKQHGATLYMTLLAAFQTLLHRYTGQEDIWVGSPTTGRSSAKFSDVLGYFINPVVLRAQAEGNLAFTDFLAQVRGVVLGALAHQEFPFPLLVERVQPKRDLSYPPLFQVMFAMQKSHLDDDGLSALAINEGGARIEGALPMETRAMEVKGTQFDLTLSAAEHEGRLTLFLEYNTDLFDSQTMERMLGHYRMLLQGIVERPHATLGELPLVTAAEQEQLLVDWQPPAKEVPPALVHERFEAFAKQCPDRPAVVMGDLSITYAELNRRANQLARYLQKRGAGPDRVVAFSMERSTDTVLCILAAFKAGAAYVALDPTLPMERLRFMLEDAGAMVLVTKRDLAGLYEGAGNGVHILCLDDEADAFAEESEENLPHADNDNPLAYLIFTSGTTGKPKAVACEHRGIMNLAVDYDDQQGLEPGDACAQWSNFSFDVSVIEYASAFLSGGTLVIAPEEVRYEGRPFFKWLSENKVCHAYIPPFMLKDMARWLAEGNTLSLKRLLVGVEPLAESLLVDIAKRVPGLTIINGYGPTETTVVSTFYAVPIRDESEVGDRIAPIGRGVINTSVYLLDASRQLVPVGVPGEIYIGGINVARGYVNRPELTAEKFVFHSFDGKNEQRLYRTGDLAKWLPEGLIEFVGRVDHQVKIRGFRIELNEIEAVLEQHPAIRECLVIAREDVPGQKRLVGYVVYFPGNEHSPADLRAYLADKLPDYMIPSAFVVLDALPLTPNAKVDRNAVPAPENTRDGVDTEYVAPQTEIEKALTAIWQEVLGVEKVGVDDNFFDLGGHSLLMAGAHAKVQELVKRDFSIVKMFQHPTIRTLAEFLSEDEDASALPAFSEVRDQASKKRAAVNRQKQLRKDRRN